MWIAWGWLRHGGLRPQKYPTGHGNILIGISTFGAIFSRKLQVYSAPVVVFSA